MPAARAPAKKAIVRPAAKKVATPAAKLPAKKAPAKKTTPTKKARREAPLAKHEVPKRGQSPDTIGTIEVNEPTDSTLDLGIRPTGTPGVWINANNVLCDEDGMRLDFEALNRRDKDRLEEVLGEAVDTPGKFLKAVSLDPRQPIAMRVKAARAAAPYTDAKKPILIGNADDKPFKAEMIHSLKGLSMEQLGALAAMLGGATADEVDKA